MTVVWYLLCLIYLVQVSEQTPILVDKLDFQDDWDYRLVPQDKPLLQTVRLHTIATSKRNMSKQLHEEKYDVVKLEGISRESAESALKSITCSTCRLGVTFLRAEVMRNSSFEDIKLKLMNICVSFKIATESMCNAIMDIYGPVVLPVLKASQLETEQICGLLLGEKCGNIDNPTHEWNIEMTPTAEGDIWASPPPMKDVPIYKVLHLSDTHFDPEYMEGSIANCKEPLCCRSHSTAIPDEDIVAAGKWGSLGKCDSPQVLIENMLDNIVLQHPDIDYIIWTGDIPPHDIMNQTRENNIANIKFTVGKLFEAFPNVPIFPALGNHEGVPAGNNPPPWVKNETQSVSWLYKEIASEWSKFLPADVNNTIFHGAYYSVLIRPKFRIISINTNYCYVFSWWLVLNSTDPAHELKWLQYELELAEMKGEKVHIIGHIPPGQPDCYKVWSRNYYNIINRFRNTVVAQFFGHLHTDEFELFYDNDEFKKPTAIAYIGPSVTTFEHLNPGYRIYYVDGEHETTTNEVIDHETWIMDLANANENPDDEPIWFPLYSARKDLKLKTLRPSDWGKLIHKMVYDEKRFQQFYRYMYKASPTRPECTDNKCKFGVICNLKSAKSHSKYEFCHNEEEILLKLERIREG